jgi:uncharacterized protein (TIGR03083 family)
METILEQIDERSAAFRAAVAAAESLDAVVPSCPQWTLFDLVRHLGEGRRKWAAIVAAGAADGPPPKSVWESAVPREREALLAWSAESTRLMLDAMRAAGPGQVCWTWWEGSASPSTVRAAARHQVQEVAVHTWDAQLVNGDPRHLPDEIALDGVDEFLSTSCAGPYPWPHQPATVVYHATEGRSWQLTLAKDGVTVQAKDNTTTADAEIWGTASELVLVLFGRIPVDELKVAGDRRIFDLLLEWDPDE